MRLALVVRIQNDNMQLKYWIQHIFECILKISIVLFIVVYKYLTSYYSVTYFRCFKKKNSNPFKNHDNGKEVLSRYISIGMVESIMIAIYVLALLPEVQHVYYTSMTPPCFHSNSSKFSERLCHLYTTSITSSTALIFYHTAINLKWTMLTISLN